MLALILLLGLIYFCNCDPNVTDLIRSYGYPAEEHVAETSDGFLLRIQRIPYGKKGNQNPKVKRPVAFLHHGLLDSAATWVVNPPNEALGFILADAGFDVFLGNARGNTWSSQNTKYSTDDPVYWNKIDFDNMIHIDLATQINKALNVSGQQKLVYIGHSQGTVMGFGGFSLYPELAAKVSLFIALAPVAYVSHQTSFLLTILSDLDVVLLVELLGYRDFLPSSTFLHEFGGVVCNNPDLSWACADVIFILCGYDRSNLNNSRIPLYVDYTPAGTSVRNMAHWAQLVQSGKFRMYDYGFAENLIVYGTLTPPDYPLQNLVSPKIAFFTGTKDDLADPTDVQRLIEALPDSNKPIYINNQQTYQHLDFTWGENANELIYPDVVELALKYSSN
jgi:pimeloyl-ACP methyl ester carboxylesterase